MHKWSPLFFLPNMCIKEPFDSEYLAIVSPNDVRCIEINSRHPTFLPFLNRFTDTFGRKIVPSVLIMRDDAPAWVKNMEAVGGFRDILSICAVVYNRTAVLIHHLPRNYQYSTSFDFYAYTLTTDYQRLVTSNPALSGMDLIEEFHGQTTPGLPVSNWDRLDYDEMLLKALLAEWERRFSSPKPSWRSLALFRSLNMAHAAAQIPGVVGVTNYSLGRSISLCVSAFEILVHPEKDESGVKRVYDLLNQVDWRTQACKENTYYCYEGRGKKTKGPPRNLACWIYGEINHARIDYLHGNPLNQDRLVVQASGKHLFNYNPSLYGLLLTGFLGLNYYGPFKPREPGASPYDAVRMLKYRFYSKQGDYENALAHIRKPKNPKEL
ncbi:hypothetical protein [Bradyrhizobium sp. ARR65]|uniref:hypothetical protein n=1 Tax=Bradyrhizobium sp. ARR65 TaxID=1040989 RepID=UPI0004670D17|nr:hypothetical protein [Bradyrhizobium sp. ARR65]